MRVASIMVAALICATVARGEDWNVLPDNLAEGPKTLMLHRHLMRLAHEALDRRDAVYEKLKEPEELLAHQRELKKLFRQQISGFPERSPLRPVVKARETRDGYLVEKIIFESQPQHFVTALLYLPDTEARPFPAVLVPCGHTPNGKAGETYQRACILLAKNGIAAFCYDPIGQGERLQILPAEGEKPFGSTTEHTLVGVSSIPLGTSTARYRIWDGMRALDYLSGRLEIDASRLGCAGNSGGGTLTSYLMALDERIVCAAPSCYITSMRRLLETIGPQDAEQNIFGQVTHGMTHAEYILMRAPKPTLICTATQDFFDILGAWATYREAKRWYMRQGHGERVDLAETDAKHGFTTQLREANARWMRRWLLHVDDVVTETESPLMSDAQAQCTEEGQVMQMVGARSVFDLNADWEDRLALQRKVLWAETSRPELLDRIRKLAGIRPLAELSTPEVQTVGRSAREGYEVRKLLLKPESDVLLPALALVPTNPKGQAVLVVDSNGKQIAVEEGSEFDRLARNGTLVVSLDVRGLGEMLDPKSAGMGTAIGPGWRDWFLGYLLEKSHVGMWAEDILTTTRWLASYESGAKPNAVRLVAIGKVGPAALHAAALERDLFQRTDVRQSLQSWALVVRAKGSKHQLPTLVHGALAVYDLPNLVEMLGVAKVNVIEPRDAQDEPIEKQ